MENPCGKGCGECGKLPVFNRYLACCPYARRLWKSLHTGLHKTDYKQVTEALRRRPEPEEPVRIETKKLEDYQKWLSKPVAGLNGAKYFCEKPPKIFERIFLTPGEILFPSNS